MKTAPLHTDSTIALVVLAVLVVGVYLVIQPFLTAIVWAAVLAAIDVAGVRLAAEAAGQPFRDSPRPW